MGGILSPDLSGLMYDRQLANFLNIWRYVLYNRLACVKRQSYMLHSLAQPNKSDLCKNKQVSKYNESTKEGFMALLKLVLGVFVIVMFSVGSSFAQFPDLGQLGGNKTSAASGVSLQDLIKNKEKTAGSYLKSIQSMALGLETTAKAFGIQNQITDKLAIINSLQSGSISDAGISKARQASDAILGMIKAKMQTGTGLNPGSQGLFTQGLTGVVTNIQTLQNLIPEAKNLLSMAQGTLTTAPLQDKLKIQDIVSTVSTLAKNIPLDLKSNQGILSVLSSYASAHNISVPQEAINLLKAN